MAGSPQYESEVITRARRGAAQLERNPPNCITRVARRPPATAYCSVEHWPLRCLPALLPELVGAGLLPSQFRLLPTEFPLTESPPPLLELIPALVPMAFC